MLFMEKQSWVYRDDGVRLRFVPLDLSAVCTLGRGGSSDARVMQRQGHRWGRVADTVARSVCQTRVGGVTGGDGRRGVLCLEGGGGLDDSKTDS